MSAHLRVYKWKHTCESKHMRAHAKLDPNADFVAGAAVCAAGHADFVGVAEFCEPPIEVQISWQAQHFMNFQAQTSWQAQQSVNP